MANPFPPAVLAYAKAVKAMQALPLADPRSWRYQAAIHGLANTVPPAGAPWNSCQHSSWYFFPWHRMYLFQFERIVRSFVTAAGGPANWTLPFWDYSSGAPRNSLPAGFRLPKLPDNSANPLFVAQRRSGINTGTPLPPAVVSTTTALNKTVFTNQGANTGFGGPQTGFNHQGGAFGALEATPHGSVHVQVGGPTGLMTDPDLAALDPIFWLHHANVDRLWDVWRLKHQTNVNPTTQSWLTRNFSLRNTTGAAVTMKVSGVVSDITQLDYTYEGLPAQALAAEEGGPGPVPRGKKPVMVGRNDRGLTVTTDGGSAEVPVGELPQPRAAAAAGSSPRLYLDLADIEGEKNPGIVYGVYLNLPKGAGTEVRDEHMVGVVSFFGIEHAGTAPVAPKSRDPHPLHYSFDVTEVVDGLRAKGAWDPGTFRVALLPIEGSEPEGDDAALAAPPPVRVGSVSLFAG